MKLRNKLWMLLFILIFAGCSTQPSDQPVGAKIAAGLGVKGNPESPFYLPQDVIPGVDTPDFKTLPIGVFDSGTGGLTVLEELLKFDEYDNSGNAVGGDGTPDLMTEDFVYFGDMANMPYGNYPAEGKTNFLEELCVKDGLFLLNSKYHASPESAEIMQKTPVKIIVIACNTGTAYGKEAIEEMIEYLDLDIDVIGVVPSGAKGSLEHFEKDESGTVGVMATVGTISSGAYPASVREFSKKEGYSGTIDIVQQGGFGLAESIDSDPDYIDRDWKGTSPRDGYIGPSMMNEKFPIHADKLPLYNFSMSGNELLYKKSGGAFTEIQINSVRNYTRYHVTELVLKMKEQNVTLPLKAIILGCTHYPYVGDEITSHLAYLAGYEDKKGDKPFAELLSSNVPLVDPAILTARETYLALERKNALNDAGKLNAEFYISTPNKDLPGTRINELNRFDYDYKYGRVPFYLSTGDTKVPPVYVLRVPMNWETLNDATIDNVKSRLPFTYKAMKAFNGGKEH